jgi:hypothetical protein
MPTYLKKNVLGHAEIMGSGEFLGEVVPATPMPIASLVWKKSDKPQFAYMAEVTWKDNPYATPSVGTVYADSKEGAIQRARQMAHDNGIVIPGLPGGAPLVQGDDCHDYDIEPTGQGDIASPAQGFQMTEPGASNFTVVGNTGLKRDTLGRVEIVGSDDFVGLIFDKALDVGTFSSPTPTRYQTTVYRQRQRRFGGAKSWDRETDFTEDTEDAARKKAQDYISAKKWAFIPYDERDK